MSIYISGSLSRSPGLSGAITKQLKLINLKPVKRIQVQFDPFHQKALVAREFLFNITLPYVRETNFSCAIKPVVVCDRSDPEIKIDLLDSSCVKFLANNLTVLEILQQINKHISSKVPKEEPVSAQATKIEKKKLQKKR